MSSPPPPSSSMFVILILLPWMVLSCRLQHEPEIEFTGEQFGAEDVFNQGANFVDLRVGTNLTLVCIGQPWLRADNTTGERLHWILPEFHPGFEESTPLPEYINIENDHFSNASGVYLRSTLNIFGVETNDVGHYICTYTSYLHLAEDQLRGDRNALYLYVTDMDNLFVKSIPILTAIHGRPAELGCRPASSLVNMSLYRIDPITRQHIALPYRMIADDGVGVRMAGHNDDEDPAMITTYSRRRGFHLGNITDDKFICRAHLVVRDAVNNAILNRSADHNVLVTYTNGIHHASRPRITFQHHYPYTFQANNFTVTCSLEKDQSSHIFLKWNLLNSTCFAYQEVHEHIQLPEVEMLTLRKGKDLLRVNLTLIDVPVHMNGAMFECVASDVSLAKQVVPYRLKVYEKPFLHLLSLDPASQIQRCNRQLKFEAEILSIPSNIDLVEVVWLKESQNQTISNTDTRITIYKKYGSSMLDRLGSLNASTLDLPYAINNHSRIITAGIQILNLVPEDSGDYVLTAHLMEGLLSQNLSLSLTVLACHISDIDDLYAVYLVAISLIIFIMLMFIFLLAHRIRVEKKAKHELEILSYNLISSTKADNDVLLAQLDPNVPIHEQMDLLRYDFRWEVPLANIEFGALLGHGAFGKVYQANVIGLRNVLSPRAPQTPSKSEDPTNAPDECQRSAVAAVKMLKSHTSMEHLKALLCELKVLNYIGCHVNIVNLLGACTANLIKGELYVIVEYCQFGSLQQYLYANRGNFWTNNVNNDNDNKKKTDNGQKDSHGRRIALDIFNLIENDNNVGDDNCDHYITTNTRNVGGGGGGVGRAQQSTTPLSIATPFRRNMLEQQQQQGKTLAIFKDEGFKDKLSKLISHRQASPGVVGCPKEERAATAAAAAASGGPPGSDSIELNPLGGSKIEGKKRETLLTIEDLINFAYQTVRGMEYLSSKQLVHRDLAARNVLLDANKIVKICDFGLARDTSDYSPDYMRKSSQPLPVKWMAIESLRDKIFTTKSDVWSFGVFLWEVFSLGATPYPGLAMDGEFYRRLVDGHRMQRPEHSPDWIYQTMLRCWAVAPEARPSFADLAALLHQHITPHFLQHYESLREYYDNANNLLQSFTANDAARLYETLQSINSHDDQLDGGQLGGPSDYLKMSDHFTGTSRAFNDSSGDDHNDSYMQMETIIK